MLVDSLILKVPLLFIAMYCCHVSSKPPNPPASEEERVRFTARGGVRDASATMVGTPLPFIFRVRNPILHIIMQVYLMLSDHIACVIHDKLR